MCVCQGEGKNQGKLYGRDDICIETQRTIRTIEIRLGRSILETGWHEQMSRIRNSIAYKENYTQFSSAKI